MKLARRAFLRLAAGAATLPFVTRNAMAQAYPARPVRVIVGFAAGGGNDIVARLIGQWLSDRLKEGESARLAVTARRILEIDVGIGVRQR
jgi:tripartite-type tricarboxylate transporter receptor subunit TctC